MTYTDVLCLEIWGDFRQTHINRTQNSIWWQRASSLWGAGMGNGGDQALLGQERGEGPDVQVRSPGFVRDARVTVSSQGDGGPLPSLPLLDPHSKRPWEAQTSEPLSQAGICCSLNEDSRLPSWHPLVHHGGLLEGSNLQGGVPELHHLLPHTPAAQVPL